MDAAVADRLEDPPRPQPPASSAHSAPATSFIASEARPRADVHAVYDGLYEIFNEAYDSLESSSIFRRLAAFDTA